jgi:UDP:flavonoid glycosyltransferase YjiC (YdhE family)
MRVLIGAVGTMGDVAPYTGLVAPLKEAGHEVAIAAYPRFADMVRACGAEFREIPGDPAAVGEWTQPESTSRAMKSVTQQMLDIGESLLGAAKQGTDVMLLSLASMSGMHVAESLGIPSMGVFVEPMYKTVAHPPPFLGIGTQLGPVRNRMLNGIVHGMLGRVTHGTIQKLRSRLGLPGLSRSELTARMNAWTVLHGYSPHVLPRPVDWPAPLDVVGYWFPAVQPSWEPAPELVDFLAAGPPPVYVSFGSRQMSKEEGTRIAGVVDGALRRAGARGVIQAGWADLASRSAETITIRETSYEWLFPRVAAVVHHAGAGTTASGLRAGVPTVGVPILAYQPFWAGRVHTIGIGPQPVPYKKLSTERLGDAITAALSNPSYREAGAVLRDRIAAEDGAGKVVAAVDRLTA